VSRDLELEHLLGWLKLALDALVKHYGLVDQREAA
jgi:hypothetical protein